MAQQLNVNMHTPRVSILMPIYNVEKYLREAMDSMLSQTFTDFELICLDDCSPDHSTEILDGYSDPRIVRYRGKKNVGLANILNIGMDMARGEYIARMDSDDISLPNRLQVQVDYLGSHPEIDLVSVGMQQFGRTNSRMRYNNYTEDIKFNALFFSPILHASSMWRKKSFADLHFRQEQVPSEDYDLWTRALVAGVKMRNIPDILYRYRMHNTQATISATGIEHNRVRLAYLVSIFPKMTRKKAQQIIQQLSCNNTKELQHAFDEIVIANKESKFFEQQTLKHNVEHYLQAKAYNEMLNTHISKNLWHYLTFKRKIKLMLNKCNKIFSHGS